MFITVLALPVICVNAVAPCFVPNFMPRLAADDTADIFEAFKYPGDDETGMKEQRMAALRESLVEANEQN